MMLQKVGVHALRSLLVYRSPTQPQGDDFSKDDDFLS